MNDDAAFTAKHDLSRLAGCGLQHSITSSMRLT